MDPRGVGAVVVVLIPCIFRTHLKAYLNDDRLCYKSASPTDVACIDENEAAKYLRPIHFWDLVFPSYTHFYNFLAPKNTFDFLEPKVYCALCIILSALG